MDHGTTGRSLRSPVPEAPGGSAGSGKPGFLLGDALHQNQPSSLRDLRRCWAGWLRAISLQAPPHSCAMAPVTCASPGARPSATGGLAVVQLRHSAATLRLANRADAKRRPSLTLSRLTSSAPSCRPPGSPGGHARTFGRLPRAGAFGALAARRWVRGGERVGATSRRVSP
jgi:hypothetical protein